MFIWPMMILYGFLILTQCKLELLLVRFEGQLCIGKETIWVEVPSRGFMETFTGDFGFILKSSEKKLSFSLLQFLASEDFVNRLGLLKCSKHFQNYRNSDMFFEPDWLKLWTLWLKCLPVLFLSQKYQNF